ncbi:serine/arginine-rich splicing factor 2-like [Hibiscus syriacus]|uniref:serine/arginine-rich splicing factor 2-like n=1 Tax=Hibiscus syriacus TaxID=106335 RepID=UPI001924F7F2|nr:serine/arginine-rich splicing factor 2-like [Hibiscus syriacus]
MRIKRDREVEREKVKGKSAFDEVWMVFMDNVSMRVSQCALRELFLGHGLVERVFIPKETRNPKYKFSTFAFVQFGSEAGLKRAVDNLNGSLIDGKRITVGATRYKEAHSRTGGRIVL